MFFLRPKFNDRIDKKLSGLLQMPASFSWLATIQLRRNPVLESLASASVRLNVHQPRFTGPAAGPDVKTEQLARNRLDYIHKLNRPSLVKSSRKARGLAPTTDENRQPDFTIHSLHFVIILSTSNCEHGVREKCRCINASSRH